MACMAGPALKRGKPSLEAPGKLKKKKRREAHPLISFFPLRLTVRHSHKAVILFYVHFLYFLSISLFSFLSLLLSFKINHSKMCFQSPLPHLFSASTIPPSPFFYSRAPHLPRCQLTCLTFFNLIGFFVFHFFLISIKYFFCLSLESYYYYYYLNLLPFLFAEIHKVFGCQNIDVINNQRE